jgi:zinc and cadmium transporter
MTPFEYIGLFGLVMLSGLSIFVFKTINERYLKLLLSFSGSYLFALCVLHLIPEVYSRPVSTIGIYILFGFFLQIVIEFMSEGIEHGHLHLHEHHRMKFPVSILIGLCLHSFLEGMPLSQAANDPKTTNSLLAGIILHHSPVAFALMSMMLSSGNKPAAAVSYLTLFALMAPLGAALSANLSFGGANAELYSTRIMAIVIGIFLHISTTILFESNKNHLFNYYKLVIILLGAGLAVITL